MEGTEIVQSLRHNHGTRERTNALAHAEYEVMLFNESDSLTKGIKLVHSTIAKWELQVHAGCGRKK